MPVSTSYDTNSREAVARKKFWASSGYNLYTSKAIRLARLQVSLNSGSWLLTNVSIGAG
jgi:hypothetical protein